MKEKQWFQCQECGKLSCADVQVDINKLYTKLECPRCRGVTKHLWIGDNPDDVYIYGNANLDERYYEYKTK